MTQEQKELLTKDLCSRLPYGVKISMPGLWTNEEEVETLNEIFKGDDNLYRVNDSGMPIEYIKPYLFPLSSMTEKQIEELKDEISKQTEILIERMKNDDCGIDCGKYYFHPTLELEWLLKNHFDYNGLINKGLAIDASRLNIY